MPLERRFAGFSRIDIANIASRGGSDSDRQRRPADTLDEPTVSSSTFANYQGHSLFICLVYFPPVQWPCCKTHAGATKVRDSQNGTAPDRNYLRRSTLGLASGILDRMLHHEAHRCEIKNMTSLIRIES